MLAIRGASGLLVVVFNRYGFKVLGFEDLAAIETFHVLDPVAPGDHLCSGVLTSMRLHK
jgi:hypothetical protein